MKYIGKLDDYPVYEFRRGAYVIVDPRSERVMPTWAWFGNLGRNYDTFIKGGENPDDDKCIVAIEKGKDKILRQIESFDRNAESENGQDFLDEQEEFYEKLEDGRIFDWYKGDYIEPATEE